MNEICCLGSDGITHEVHPTFLLYVGFRTLGQFSSKYLVENVSRIPIIGQIPIHVSVELFVIPNFRRTSGPMFTENLLAPSETTYWGDVGTSNQNWPVFLGGPYSMWSVPWSGSFPARTA